MAALNTNNTRVNPKLDGHQSVLEQPKWNNHKRFNHQNVQHRIDTIPSKGEHIIHIELLLYFELSSN